jgi:hypothetical protein
VSRALTLRESRQAAGDRDRFLAAARERRARYAREHCNYWLFEDASAAGDFVEFVEARDADTLSAALRWEARAGAAAPRLFREVELD